MLSRISEDGGGEGGEGKGGLLLRIIRVDDQHMVSLNTSALCEFDMTSENGGRIMCKSFSATFTTFSFTY